MSRLLENGIEKQNKHGLTKERENTENEKEERRKKSKGTIENRP